MKRLLALLGALCFLMLGDAVPLNQTVLAQNGTSAWATGHGEISGKGGALTTFSFSAHVQQDGLEEGEAEIYEAIPGKHGTLNEVRYHVDIDCVNIDKFDQPVTTAVLSGIVTQSSDETLAPINARVVIVVQDNGEGQNDPLKDLPDAMTLLTIGDPLNCISCRSHVKGILTPIDRGNIQVKALQPQKEEEK